MNSRDYIVDQLSRYPNGDAFYNLLDLPSEAVPELINAYRSSDNADIRSLLVNVIWEHRLPEVAPFLGEALLDTQSTVWKSALDGLVTLASKEAISILNAAKSRSFSSDKERSYFLSWLDEAIEQATEAQQDAAANP